MRKFRSARHTLNFNFKPQLLVVMGGGGCVFQRGGGARFGRSRSRTVQHLHCVPAAVPARFRFRFLPPLPASLRFLPPLLSEEPSRPLLALLALSGALSGALSVHSRGEASCHKRPCPRLWLGRAPSSFLGRAPPRAAARRRSPYHQEAGSARRRGRSVATDRFHFRPARLQPLLATLLVLPISLPPPAPASSSSRPLDRWLS